MVEMLGNGNDGLMGMGLLRGSVWGMMGPVLHRVDDIFLGIIVVINDQCIQLLFRCYRRS